MYIDDATVSVNQNPIVDGAYFVSRTNQRPPVVVLPSGAPCIISPIGGGAWHISRAPEGVPLPGMYAAEIVFSETGPTQTGRMIRLRWKILRGRFKHVEVKQFIYFEHINPGSEEVGQQQIIALLSAIGLSDDTKDASVMRGRRAQIIVGLINIDEPIVIEVRPLGSVQ